MHGLRVSHLGLATAVVALTIILLPVTARAADPAPKRDFIQIGMVDSLLRDVPDALVSMMSGPFSAIMEQQTGLKGKVGKAGNPFQVGQKLQDESVQLAIYQGIEFAWAKQQYPDLKPLMLVINQRAPLHVKVVVRANSDIASFENLAGKNVTMPKGPIEHCKTYVDQHCEDLGKTPEEFFGKLITPVNAEEAVDDVVDGEVDAVIIDAVTLECYQRRKPGRFGRLKIAAESEPFPGACVAYREGTLDAATLKRFREGMVKACSTPMGRQFMVLWKITGFEEVPAGYEASLEEIVKTYPSPYEEE